MIIDTDQYLPVQTLKQLFKILGKVGESKLVGGCVREIVQGKQPKDIDIATIVKPEEVIKLLSAAGYKCIPTGIKYGTITAMKNHSKFEITTLRKDIKTYGRDADIEFTNEWKLDASRRDFTFNALYMDLDGNIVDYFDGLSDLNNKYLKFIGNPESRIQEDYLRILRYFRFYSYFGGDNLDMTSLLACKKYANNLLELSGERIQSELLKILSSEFALDSFKLMQKYNILNVLLPRIDTVDMGILKLGQDPIINLAAIIKLAKYNVMEIDNLLKLLKLSNRDKKLIKLLVVKLNLDSKLNIIEHKTLIYRYGVSTYYKYIEFLNILNSQPMIDAIDCSNLPIFPINGNDIIKLGLAGKEIGSNIEQLEKLWIKSDFKLSKEELLKTIIYD